MCECEACLEDVTVPPVDFVSHLDAMLDQALDACWNDYNE